MKKKVSIITILDNSNIGTYLQAYALARVFLNEEADVEYVYYERRSRSLLGEAKERFAAEGHFARKIVSVIYGIIVSSVARRKCMRFLTQYVDVTRKYKCIEEIKADRPFAELYLTGSDQVWNFEHNRGLDAAYFLDYAPENSLRFSYAASIGMEHIPEEFAARVTDLLGKYSSLTVRETSAKVLLKGLGFNDVRVVLDPTLLLPRSAWESLVLDDAQLPKKRYLLVYSVESSQRMIVSSIAREIGEKRGLIICYVTSRWFSLGIPADKKFYFSSPQMYLKLFKNADFVVVSSFHGTVFSLNFSVPFVSVVPARFNSRISSLLTMLGLEERMVRNLEQASLLANSSIDFSAVNKKLDEEREKSLGFIRFMLR